MPWTLTVEGGPDFGQENLVRRAAKLFMQETGVTLRGHSILKKNIPIGGGLGGGSSDAAGMLLICKQLFPATQGTVLQKVATMLGSDVPFFLTNGCSWGRGRGEILQPCTWKLSVKQGFVIVPPFGLSTAEVFAALTASPWDKSNLLTALPSVSEAQIGFNDLFESACRVSQHLKSFAKSLQATIPDGQVFMTGSGSSFIWLSKSERVPNDLNDVLESLSANVLPFTFWP